MGNDIEPAHACPEIDSRIKYAKTEIEETADVLKRQASDLEYTLNDIVEGFESCRHKCEELRAWGQGWKERAEELDGDIENYQEEIRCLRRDYEIRINDLEHELARANELAREDF